MSSKTQAPDGPVDYAPASPLTSDDAGYRTLANALPIILWTCDARGQLEWVSERWCELTGQSQEQALIDKGALEPVHPDDRAEVMRGWQQSLETSAPGEIEYRIRTREGVYRWYVAQIAPIRGADGSITRWVAATFDVHNRREAEDALRASARRVETVVHLNP